MKSTKSCNHDCFNCKCEDCIVDNYSYEEYKQQKAFDTEVKNEGNVSERHQRYLREKAKYSEQMRNRAKKYYYEHKEAQNKKSRDYYASHKEYFREHDRRYRKMNPVSKEKRHEYYIRWRDKKREEKEKGIV